MRRPRLQVRAGAVLLEAIVALAVLGSILGTGAWLGAEAVRTVAHAHTTESMVRDADRLLRHVSLWSRRDLDLHLGDTHQHPWRLRVERREPTLYDVTIVDDRTGAAMLLTTLFRSRE